MFLLSGGKVAWAFKKKPIVTLSTIEAEYVAASSCAYQSVCIHQILKQIKGLLSESVKIISDNLSTIKLANNHVFNGRCKHIEVRFHFLKNMVSDGAVSMDYCGLSK